MRIIIHFQSEYASHSFLYALFFICVLIFKISVNNIISIIIRDLISDSADVVFHISTQRIQADTARLQ